MYPIEFEVTQEIIPKEHDFFIEMFLDIDLNDPNNMNIPLECPITHQGLNIFGAIPWPQEMLDQRWGTGVTQFSEIQTSMARPVEVCGKEEQHEWLAKVQCPNGKLAFKDPYYIPRYRIASMGEGGRCSKIVDAYKVTCGKEKKTVYMDMYHCSK